VAVGLAKDDSYFAGLAGELERKRNLMAEGLARIGFGVLPTHGSYFISADFRPLGFNGDDMAFCRHITEAAKVTAVPVTDKGTDNVLTGNVVMKKTQVP
jgi:aspartate/methionine/tyrosine aminotransferase